MYNAAVDVLRAGNFTVKETLELQGRKPRYADIPQFLSNSPVGLHLKQGITNGLWSHQAQALDLLGSGRNVVVSTGTASGKSLIFQSIAMHKVLLDDSSRVIVFYPLKALIADQLRGWRRMAQSLGLGEDIVGQIDGDVKVRDRDHILQSARIVIMTPDVCQAWMMANVASPKVRTYIGNLSMVVMDEAHSLESVFGSNFAFLIRRLTVARNCINQGTESRAPLQFLGATATISNPDQHLHRLTGADFSVVDHNDDGAPLYDRLVAHVVAPEGSEFAVTREIQTHLLTKGTEGNFITFIDSRKGVEQLVIDTRAEIEALTNDKSVTPYRAGFSAHERIATENGLRNGTIKGVVSTSALELGIDIPHLAVGVNVGIPASRKSYRQRLGRTGRRGPGVFLIVGTSDTFSRFGTSLQEYHDMSVEDSYLYLDNRFMQFAHARCLADEMESLGATHELPVIVEWPHNFDAIYAAARPGGNYGVEYDHIARVGGDTPHRSYPMRNIAETNYDIKHHENADSIGDIGEVYALRECYPGATYLHNTEAYEVLAWRRGFQPFIHVKRTSPFRRTTPLISTWINAEVMAGTLMGSSLLKGKDGFLAECQMQVSEQVRGYHNRQTGDYLLYKELRQRNPNMVARTRRFRTSGVIFHIENEWFKQDATRRVIADRLREIFVHEYSINPQDIGSATSNIQIQSVDDIGRKRQYIAIFDQAYGSLRLTEKLYTNFAHILRRLSDSLADDFKPLVDETRTAFNEFTPYSPLARDGESLPSGYVNAFAPRSTVLFHDHGGVSQEVQIIQLTIREDGRLMYQVEGYVRPGQPALKRWIPFESVEESADPEAYNYAPWNLETQEYEVAVDESAD